MANQVQYFLGANSSEGFRSFYDDIFQDPRVKTVWIIKGGSGNGKSTVMRALGALAETNGLAQEYALCSSDPDSLDGVIIPQVGLAVLDGTAPHVVEPPLCGMGVFYLNFSTCYRPGMEENAEQILDAQRQNKAQYPPAYSCLSAGAKLDSQIYQTAAAHLSQAQLAQIASGIVEAEFTKTGSGAATIRRFLSGITPKGLQYRLEALTAFCSRLYAFSDTFGISHDLLALLHQQALRRGYFCVTGHSPLVPDRLEQLLIPELSIGFVRTSQQLSYHGSSFCRMDLDLLCSGALSDADKKHLPFLVCTVKALVQEAISYLQEAKLQHDRLELLCRPYVDFTAVSALQSKYCARLQKMIDKKDAASS